MRQSADCDHTVRLRFGIAQARFGWEVFEHAEFCNLATLSFRAIKEVLAYLLASPVGRVLASQVHNVFGDAFCDDMRADMLEKLLPALELGLSTGKDAGGTKRVENHILCSGIVDKQSDPDKAILAVAIINRDASVDDARQWADDASQALEVWPRLEDTQKRALRVAFAETRDRVAAPEPDSGARVSTSGGCTESDGEVVRWLLRCGLGSCVIDKDRDIFPTLIVYQIRTSCDEDVLAGTTLPR